jgi:hypothetical protein
MTRSRRLFTCLLCVATGSILALVVMRFRDAYFPRRDEAISHTLQYLHSADGSESYEVTALCDLTTQADVSRERYRFSNIRIVVLHRHFTMIGVSPETILRQTFGPANG